MDRVAFFLSYIRACFAFIGERTHSHRQLGHRHSAHMASGCCKPPTVCGYVYERETVWKAGAVAGANPDCSRWSNDQSQLCYECDSCKAGVLASLKTSWRKVSVINIVVMIILVIAYIIAYAAFRNNRKIDNDEPSGEARMTKVEPSRIHF